MLRWLDSLDLLAFLEVGLVCAVLRWKCGGCPLRRLYRRLWRKK